MRYEPRVMMPSRSDRRVLMSRNGSIRDASTGDVIESVTGDYIWDRWCAATRRPADALSCPEGVLDRLWEFAGLWERSVPFLDDLIITASYHPIIDGDDSDTERLLRVLNSESARVRAESVRYQSFQGPIHFGDSGFETHRAQVLRDFGISGETELDPDDESKIDRICQMSQDSYDSVRESFPDDGSLDQFIERLDFRAKPKPDENRSIPSGFAPSPGSTTSPDDEGGMNSMSMEVDLPASAMVLRGYTTEQIMMFHNNVPPGYWQAVIDEIDNPDSDLDVEEIYDELTVKFGGFHPDQREKPGNKETQ